MNIRSIVNKLNQFHSLIYSKDYNIIAITDTWLSDNILDQEIIPTDYTIYSKDRSSRGGGVMLAVKHSIPSHALNISMESETLCAHIGNENSVTLCLVYVPPNSPEMHIQSLCDYISTTVSHSNNKYLLLGDFNLPTINWDILQGETPISNLFCDLVFNLNLIQMINEPTHIYGNILDLVLTTNGNKISPHYWSTFITYNFRPFCNNFLSKHKLTIPAKIFTFLCF